MQVYVGLFLFLAAVIGLVLLFVQLGSLVRHVRERPKTPTRTPRMSVLKPLCGIDDDLAESLELFCALDYPDYELVLGVETRSDPAYALAREVAARHPGLVRVVVQDGAPGLNPKVNQLIGLERASTGELLVVSDSNSRARPEFLREIAALFEEPKVGLVAHPIVGAGETTVGAALDNLHIASMGLGVVAAKRVAGKDLCIGKTMSVRRADLARLGGFTAVKDVLAEDYVLACWIPEKLGLSMAMASTPIESVASRRTVRQFYARYARWAVMHRFAVTKTTFTSELLLNPFFLALLGFCVWPTRLTLAAALLFALARTAVDFWTIRLMRAGSMPLSLVVFSPLKDVLVFVAWLHGATHDRVMWRGHPLLVRPGTVLVREGAVEESPDESALPAAAGSTRMP